MLFLFSACCQGDKEYREEKILKQLHVRVCIIVCTNTVKTICGKYAVGGGEGCNVRF